MKQKHLAETVRVHLIVPYEYICKHDTGSPLHRENRQNGPKISCQGKHREFGSFVKTQGIQGILFAQVLNSLILNIQHIAIFAGEFSNFFKSVSLMELLRISKIGTGKIFNWTGKTGNL